MGERPVKREVKHIARPGDKIGVSKPAPEKKEPKQRKAVVKKKEGELANEVAVKKVTKKKE